MTATRRRSVVLGVRPPSEHLALSGYSGATASIALSPDNSRVPSLGLFYVGGVILRELQDLGDDAEVRYVDMAAEAPSQTYPYIGPYQDSAQLPYAGGSIVKLNRGAGFERLDQELDDAAILFLSVAFTSNSACAAQVAWYARQRRPDLCIIVGGRDAQHRPDYYLQRSFDAVFLGQAEGIVGIFCHTVIQHGRIESMPGVATSTSRSVPSQLATGHQQEVRQLRSNIPAFLRTPDLRHQTYPYFGNIDLRVYDQSSDGPWPESVTGPAMWYLTSVGCPRECSFCVTASAPYIAMPPQRVFQLLDHYLAAGIRTLLSAEDNFLARLLRNPELGESEIIEIVDAIREAGFAHEFTDGLEVGLLMDRKGRLRTRLIEHLFRSEMRSGRLTGTVRLYWPIETLLSRDRFSKLRSTSEQLQILEAVLAQGIPQVGFGIILFRNLTQEQLVAFETRLMEFCDWMHAHHRQTDWRCAIFHELPLPGAANFSMYEGALAFDIERHPELWALPVNPVNGDVFDYAELFAIKRRIQARCDPSVLESWDMAGRYPMHE